MKVRRIKHVTMARARCRVARPVFLGVVTSLSINGRRSPFGAGALFVRGPAS